MTAREYSESAKAFIIPYEAWYAEDVLDADGDRYIMVGFYYENEGTEGEFQFVWTKNGIRLKSYIDSWEALSKMPELLEMMAKLDHDGAEPTVNEFAGMLKDLGYKDRTERVRDGNKPVTEDDSFRKNCCKNCCNASGYGCQDGFECLALGHGIRGEQYDCEHFLPVM